MTNTKLNKTQKHLLSLVPRNGEISSVSYYMWNLLENELPEELVTMTYNKITEERTIQLTEAGKLIIKYI
jgi:hypothetical protein